MKWLIRGGSPVTGAIRLPGDKSITHRALIIGALAHGDTRIRGGGWGADCQSTLTCLQAMGVACEWRGTDELVVHGTGGGLQPTARLDCGNSGTTMRLLAGALASLPLISHLDGDQSLCARPMARIAAPLRAMGASVTATAGDYPPLVIGGGRLRGIDWRTDVASAQVKSAILLAALNASGPTTVREPAQSRDHTERMLAAAGAGIVHVDELTTTLIPQGSLHGSDISVPFDFSAAAFWIAAAVATPGSEFSLGGVGLNPTRTGLLEALGYLGADIRLSDERLAGCEPLGTVTARAAVLSGCEIGGAIIPRVIDELPVLAALATAAHGQTVISDATELRVKESDRIKAMADGLRCFGATVEERPDGWVIDGPARLRAARVDCGGDHRVAMALAVAALLADGVSEIEGVACAAVSDPFFAGNLARIGALADH